MGWSNRFIGCGLERIDVHSPPQGSRYSRSAPRQGQQKGWLGKPEGRAGVTSKCSSLTVGAHFTGVARHKNTILRLLLLIQRTRVLPQTGPGVGVQTCSTLQEGTPRRDPVHARSTPIPRNICLNQAYGLRMSTVCRCLWSGTDCRCL